MSWGSLKTKRPSIPLALQREQLPMLELQVLRTRKLFGVVRPQILSSVPGRASGWLWEELRAGRPKAESLPFSEPDLGLAFTKSLLSDIPSPRQKARGEDHRGPGAISPVSVLSNKNGQWFKELTCRPGFF